MTVDQRNAGASVTPNNTYTLDRWNGRSTQTSKYTVQQNAGSVTPPVGFSSYLGVTSSSAYSITASDYFMLQQPIEGYNIADLNWGTANAKTVTLSFWVRSSLTGTFGGALGNNSFSRSYPFSYTISSANTWTQASVTIAGDTTGTWETTSSTGISLYIGMGVGSTYSGTAGAWVGSGLLSTTGATSVVGTSGATFYITGVQLEKGSSATGYEYRQYGTELALCQRYYYKIVGTTGGSTFGLAFNRNTTTAQTFVNFQTSMRSAPTALETNGTASDYQVNYLATATACNAVPTFDKATVYGSDIYFTVASGLTAGQCSKPASVSTSAYLAWSAEL
jgi:hypothetical protein